VTGSRSDTADLARALDWTTEKLRDARRERDLYRGWFNRLVAAGALDAPSLRAELERVLAERERVFNARTRKRQETAADKRAEAIRRYQAGEPVKTIALDLRRSERWVYGVIPENMKRRR
jgi:hypothetical protein